MKSIIKQMFYGKKGNCDNIKPTKRYKKLLEIAIACEDDLKAKLNSSPKLLELYLKAIDAVEILNEETVTAHYIEGFKLGVLLGLELL